MSLLEFASQKRYPFRRSPKRKRTHKEGCAAWARQLAAVWPWRNCRLLL